MDLKYILEKGNININFKKENLKQKLDSTQIKEIINKIDSISKLEKISYMEISHDYSLAFEVMLDIFKEGVCLTDQSFESMLMYHYGSVQNKNLTIYNHSLTLNAFNSLPLNEKFNFVFSFFGISFDNLYSLMNGILNFLKIESIFACLIPAYWYDNSNLNDAEKQIMSYSKQNDKKWIFVEKIDNVVEKNGGKILELIQMPFTIKINRFELAYISSLEKLYDAIIKKNTAHLEICGIQENDIELKTSLLIIKKTKKTLTKDNLFKT